MANKVNWEILADTAKDLMSKNVISINETATVNEAVSIFKNNVISAIPVINLQKEPVGLISKTDIIRYEGETSAKVLELITGIIFSVEENTSTQDVVTRMIEESIHHVLVVNNKQLVGIISSVDVLKKMYVSNI